MKNKILLILTIAFSAQVSCPMLLKKAVSRLFPKKTACLSFVRKMTTQRGLDWRIYLLDVNLHATYEAIKKEESLIANNGQDIASSLYRQPIDQETRNHNIAQARARKKGLEKIALGYENQLREAIKRSKS